MPSPQQQKYVWQYFMDDEGHFWHEGVEMDDPGTLRSFMSTMELLPNGRFKVLCQGEECHVVVQDVPYVVKGVHFFADHIELLFPGGYKEALNPSTLFVGPLNVLYCKIRDGEFTARFNRSTYLEIAKKIQFDPREKSFYLRINNQDYTIVGTG